MEEIFEILFKLIIEIILKGPGYIIIKIFYPRDKFDPDGCAVVIVGFLFWTIVGLLIWGAIKLWN